MSRSTLHCRAPMRRFLGSCLLCLLAASALAVPARAQASDADSSTYRVYTSDGEPASLDAILAAMDTADVVLIGEVHDDSVAHAVERELLRGAYERFGDAGARPVALSLEMFARDVQPVVDEYLGGLITEEHFLDAARPWPNYATDYRPLVAFAKAHDIPVIAANAPRRYVNRVAREGKASLGALSAEAKTSLPPLPYADPSEAYRAQFREAMRQAMEAAREEHPHTEASSDSSEAEAAHGSPHGGAGAENLIQAQALWDAAMAFSIAEHLMRYPETLVLHVAGAFHVERGTGIAEHLARYRPSARVVSVALRPADDPAAFDGAAHGGRGTFVVLIGAERSASPARPGGRS